MRPFYPPPATMGGMALRIRYRLGSILWAVLLLAVSFGWLADHVRLMRQYQMIDQERLKGQSDLEFARLVNKDLNEKLKRVMGPQVE